MDLTDARERLPYGVALAISEELDLVRECYGGQCLSFVKRALLTSNNPEWVDVVIDAVQEWNISCPKFEVDLNS